MDFGKQIQHRSEENRSLIRTVQVQFLTPDKRVVWILVPWGKRYLDWYRKQGYVILMTEQW